MIINFTNINETNNHLSSKLNSLNTKTTTTHDAALIFFLNCSTY